MSEDVLLVLKSLFGDPNAWYRQPSIWSLFTGWHIPGTNLTPASWAMFCLVFYTGLRFLKRILGGENSDEK